MLSFFQKKTYLIDLIEGTTDFHNHILPGIDDGAREVEDSINLIKGFKEIGIETLVATPHVIGDYYPNNPETISKALNSIKTEIPADIKISTSAEYMIDQYFLDIIEKRKILPIIGKNVLVEMSYFQAPINLNEILFQLQNNSFSPILAHPERYAYMHSKDLEKFKELKSRGCTFQLNMLSLIGHYGSGIQKMAFQLLEENMIDYLGSDVHRIDHIEKIKQVRISKKHLPAIEKTVENNRLLFTNN